MILKRFFSITILVLVFFLFSLKSFARGHDGFFLGFGYEQLFMYTTEDQLNGPNQTGSEKIFFSPGYGAQALIGFDFEGTRFGIQLPVEYSYFKLNKSEYTHYVGISLEGILHLARWDNGIDFSLIAGGGSSFITEGTINNNTGVSGIHASFGPAMNYFFATEEIKGSIYIQMPFRTMYYFGNHLSANHTTIIAVPIRIGLSVGF